MKPAAEHDIENAIMNLCSGDIYMAMLKSMEKARIFCKDDTAFFAAVALSIAAFFGEKKDRMGDTIKEIEPSRIKTLFSDWKSIQEIEDKLISCAHKEPATKQ